MEQTNEVIEMSIIVSTILLLVVGAVLVVFVFLFQSRRFKYRQDLMQMEQNFQKELLRTELEVKEQTFKNISEELHDNVGQVLSLVKLNLSNVDGPAQPKVEAAIDLVGKAVNDLRDISRSMDPERLSGLSLVQLLKQELQQLEKSGRYKVSFLLQGEERPIEPARQMILYRICQEAFNNIIKHAGADAVVLELRFEQHYFLLRISDTGKGLQGSPQKKDGGAGLINMRKRAQLIGLDMLIDSNPGKGTNLIFSTQNPHQLYQHYAG